MFSCILLPLGYMLMNSHQCSLRSLEIYLAGISTRWWRTRRITLDERDDNVTTRLNKSTIILTHITKTRSYETYRACLVLYELRDLSVLTVRRKNLANEWNGKRVFLLPLLFIAQMPINNTPIWKKYSNFVKF